MIDKYLISESRVYTPFDIQEGNHNEDDNIGATINVDRTLLPLCLEGDEDMVADVIWDWFNSFPAKPKPDWIVD